MLNLWKNVIRVNNGHTSCLQRNVSIQDFGLSSNRRTTRKVISIKNKCCCVEFLASMEAASLRYPGLNLFVGLTVAMGVSSVEGVKRGTSARDQDVSKLPEFVSLRSQTEFTDRCHSIMLDCTLLSQWLHISAYNNLSLSSRKRNFKKITRQGHHYRLAWLDNSDSLCMTFL